MTAEVYLFSVDGCSNAALQAAVDKLIRGLADCHDGLFVPSTAVLARLVRYEDYRIDTERLHAQRLFTKEHAVIETDCSASTQEERTAFVKSLSPQMKRIKS